MDLAALIFLAQLRLWRDRLSLKFDPDQPRVVLAGSAEGGQWTSGGGGWKIATRYGSRQDEIADVMVAEWEAAGRPMPEWGQWAFGLSHVSNRKLDEI